MNREDTMKGNPKHDYFLTVLILSMCLLSVIMYSLDYL